MKTDDELRKEHVRDMRDAYVKSILDKHTPGERRFIYLAILFINRTAKLGLAVSLFIAVSLFMLNQMGLEVVLVPDGVCCEECWKLNSSLLSVFPEVNSSASRTGYSGCFGCGDSRGRVVGFV